MELAVQAAHCSARNWVSFVLKGGNGGSRLSPRYIITHKHHQRFSRVMSITATQIVQAMVYDDGHIEVLRDPTLEYKGYISFCRADGFAVTVFGILSREILDELVAANVVEQDGLKNDCMVTIFRLTDEGRAEAALKQKRR